MAKNKAPSWLFYGWMSLIGIGILIGLWGAARLLIEGHGPTAGTSDQIPWGIFVPTYVFFVAASAGCVTVSLGYALGVKSFELIMKRAVFLAIVTLLTGGMVIFLDLGNPFNILQPLLSPNPWTPLWWMGVFYTLYLAFLVIDYYLLEKGDTGKTRVVSVLAALSAIAVHSTLGFVFGFAAVRTYFGSAFSPIYFMVIAIIIGTALLLFVTILQHKVTRTEMSPELHSLILNLGKFLGVAVATGIFFSIWKDLAGLRSTVETTALAYQYLLFGAGSWWYWGIVVVMGLFIPAFLLLNARTRNINGILIASTFALIGMFAARVEFTIGGQVVSLVPELKHLQWPFAHYSATFGEIAVVILAFAATAFLYTMGARKLSLGEAPDHD
jgi:molybdopterin-containing oxidoreductase family membrane subunit